MHNVDTPEIRLLDQHPSEGDLAQEILAGLSAQPKTLPPKYFYDEKGSALFDQITELPEYYPTRTELSIMNESIDDIAGLIGPRASLIELGSGSSVKIRILIDHMKEIAAYVPVEISKEHLMASARALKADHPSLEILPVCADFTKPFGLPDPSVYPDRNVVFFPGSTIGNFHPDEARDLLRTASSVAAAGGVLLIGVDLKKEKTILEWAYNDAAGITAEFNLNMLVRLNREMGADFDLDAFQHRAIYNEELGRIEMHLVSERAQVISIAGTRIEFAAGEYILTECSYKYSLDEFAVLATSAGFEVARVWTDPDKLFSVQYLICRDPAPRITNLAS